MDTVGHQGAATEISAIKVVAPNMALRVVDRAIQAHGGGGVSDDFPLARHVRGACARSGSPTDPMRSTGDNSPGAELGRYA